MPLCRRRIKFNQRFSLMYPDEEKYAAEIETAVYNALLKNIVKRAASEEEAAARASAWGHARAELPRGTPLQRAGARASQLEADMHDGGMHDTPPLCTSGCKMAAYAPNTYYSGPPQPPRAPLGPCSARS